MKNAIAYSTIALGSVLFTFGPAHAFFDDGNGNTAAGVTSHTKGNASGEAEGTFGLSFEGNGSTSGHLNGNAVGRADDDKGSSTGFGDGNGQAKGGAKFSMTFAGKAKSDGDFVSNNDGSMQNMFTGRNVPTYYYRPEGYGK